jgi:exodeoxyribonuclease V alpha subunit
MPAAKIELTDQQRLAVEMVRYNQVSILTGGPGTGKTTTIKKILSWAESAKLKTVQCAPTGKAAKRMEEATGFSSATIHRTLGAQMEKGEFSFGFNEMCPISCDFLIVDEASMVNNSLMADLMRAIDSDRTRLLIVGDQGQLPSVGAGAILRDFLFAGVPYVELTKIHRNSGEIVKACHAIAKGQIYEPSEILDPESGANLRHIEIDTPERIHDIIRKIVSERMPARGFDPVWDVQVISPVNSRTILSCNGLNEMLQDELNPLKTGKPKGDYLFREKDKIINIKNQGVDDTGGLPTYIVNGDMGEVVDTDCGKDGKKVGVRFLDPERRVNLSKKKNDLLLAYACTCHRLQGSEAPVIIIPVHKTLSWFCNRNWIYTAISRAKVICITVGQFRAIEMAINRKESMERKTMLREKRESIRDQP